MPAHPRCHRRMALKYPLLLVAVLTALSGCTNFDFDLRNNTASTANAVQTKSAGRPEPDARGVISYSSYQVAVARRGDTVADVAARVGLPADDIGRYNGIADGVTLRKGEILALPARVSDSSLATDPTLQPGTIDIASLAGDAIDRAGTATDPTGVQRTVKTGTTQEPTRHKVERGETAYSIARLYGVSVSSLADWNGLGPDLTVREGQYLLIPLPADSGTNVTAATPPGALTPIPTPPSAAKPLPDDEAPATETTSPLPATDLSKDKTVEARLAMPVQGSIIRSYQAGKNEGIDIAASAGTPVTAAADGTVAAITRNTDQVPILVIRHDDSLLTVYANINDIKVAKGDKVKRGQQLATVRAGDPAFLHFEVRQGFESVDPMAFLN